MKISFEVYCRFIRQVIEGKKAIVHGLDYVVMSRNLYEELTKPEPPKVFEDEETPTRRGR